MFEVIAIGPRDAFGNLGHCQHAWGKGMFVLLLIALTAFSVAQTQKQELLDFHLFHLLVRWSLAIVHFSCCGEVGLATCSSLAVSALVVRPSFQVLSVVVVAS